MKKHTTKTWINSAKKKHSDKKFDYSKVKFVDQKTEVEIGCPLHGFIWMTPRNHYDSIYGCRECGKIASKQGHFQSKTTEEFIKESKATFPDTSFDYSKTIYKGDRSEVIIGCPTHKFFSIKAKDHLRTKYGCPKCGYDDLKGPRPETRRDQDEVIQEFNEIHKYKYDYSKFVYERSDKESIVICPIEGHGEFPTTPHNHLNGRGCPKCAGNELKDLTDLKVGKLKVIRKATKKEAEDTGNIIDAAHWWVQCSCGRPKYITRSRALINGINKEPPLACKVCSDREQGLRIRKRYIEELFEMEFEYIELLRYWGTNKQNQSLVLFNCKYNGPNCKKQHITEARSIRIVGRLKTCGCIGSFDDNYASFKKYPQHANKECYYYLADVNDELIKPGITDNPESRKDQMGYRKYIFEPVLLKRAEAWTIEQIILKESMVAAPDITLPKYENQQGKFEIRLRHLIPVEVYEERLDELLDKLNSSNWEKLYFSKFRPFNN